ncbi:polyketide synthase [Streptomyces gamaensis]|uniref:Polyketide synthase n=1 Tax=Streptomyces gamaensis TaxID=1763542 RepID=A0ABW0YX20_9ACTN
MHSGLDPHHRATTPEPAAPQDHREHPGEGIAVVGIAALHPGARGPDAYWKQLTDPGAAPGGRPAGLDELDIDVADFGIPPAQAGALARMQLLMLQAARDCLADAGGAAGAPSADRTDVVVGVCGGLDRQYANALRVEGSRYAHELARAVAAPEFGGSARTGEQAADELRTALARRLGASPHDRVGEMASTIPARIASACKLRGRTLALEAADATSFHAIAHAVDTLRAHLSEAVLVVTGQREEGPYLPAALTAKGLLAGPAGAGGDDGFAPGVGEGTPSPAAGRGDGFTLGEGVGALLLKRLSTAVRDGDRIYATILGCALRHDARPGVFRYSVSARAHADAARAAHAACGVTAGSIGYVECAGGGIAAVDRAERAALDEVFADAAPGSVALGAVRERLGHTLAHAGLASVAKTALALYHRTLPPRAPTDGTEVRDTPFRRPATAEPWPAPAGGGPRRAAVTGSSLTGTLCHLVLQEHTPLAPARRTSRTRVAPQPIAVVGYGGRFGPAPDADAFWTGMLAGADRLGPLPERLLEREVYHRPGRLSLAHSYTDQGCALDVPEEPPPGLRIPPRRYAAMDPAQRVTLAVTAELLGRRGRHAPALDGTGLIAVGTNLGLGRERRTAAALALDRIETAVRSLPALAGLEPTEVATLLELLRERYVSEARVDAPEDLDGCLASGVAAVLAGEYRLAAVPVGIEAACASSLAALDVAVGRLRSGSADYALAGGVELPCNARDMVLCSALGLLSHERITPFDAAADGFTPGDGCALFLLKRYDDARRDGETVHALLRGIGASNDAKSLIAPDADGQVRAMRQAFAQTDFDPVDVDCLEAHGTGTRVGDRVETTAAARVYASPHRRAPLRIGSAKSFYGHTFAAAGAAGVLRALYALRTGVLPANAGLRTLSPDLELHRIPAVVPTGSAPWPGTPGRPRRAGVSSFGTGGINYHVLLEEHTRITTNGTA